MIKQKGKAINGDIPITNTKFCLQHGDFSYMADYKNFKF